MKRVLTAFCAIVGITGIVIAQEAAITVPIARPAEAKYVLKSFDCAQTEGHIYTFVRDASNGEVRVVGFTVPDEDNPSATIAAYLTAIGTSRSGETGSALRRANYRLLGFLSDHGYIIGVTVNP